MAALKLILAGFICIVCLAVVKSAKVNCTFSHHNETINEFERCEWACCKDKCCENASDRVVDGVVLGTIAFSVLAALYSMKDSFTSASS